MAPTEPAKCWRTVIEGERAIVPRRFQQNAPPPAKDGPRINEEITSRTILLIGDDGHKYGEIGTDGWQASFGFAPLGQAYEEAFASDPRVVLVKINEKEDVWPALKSFFAKSPTEVRT